MRTFILFTAGTLLSLGAALPAAARETSGTGDEPVTREEVREKREELREMQRELKEQEREKRFNSRRPRVWLGAQTGLGYGNVDVCPNSTIECTREGPFGTYSGNLTMTGKSSLLRLRATRGTHKGDNRRMPYEEAVLVGSRLGYSDWYAAMGYGRIVHPHDDYVGDLDGFAYDVFFAPSSRGAAGFELSFHGLAGSDGAYGSVNLGLRFGKLR